MASLKKSASHGFFPFNTLPFLILKLIYFELYTLFSKDEKIANNPADY